MVFGITGIAQARSSAGSAAGDVAGGAIGGSAGGGTASSGTGQAGGGMSEENEVIPQFFYLRVERGLKKDLRVSQLLASVASCGPGSTEMQFRTFAWCDNVRNNSRAGVPFQFSNFAGLKWGRL